MKMQLLEMMPGTAVLVESGSSFQAPNVREKIHILISVLYVISTAFSGNVNLCQFFTGELQAGKRAIEPIPSMSEKSLRSLVP